MWWRAPARWCARSVLTIGRRVDFKVLSRSKIQKTKSPAFILLVLMLLGLHATLAESQGVNYRQAEAQRAIAQGQGKEALARYESEAVLFENFALASQSPKKHWADAANAFRTASFTAREIGDLTKALVYARKALAGAEKAGDIGLKLLAVATLDQVYVRTGRVAETAELIELGFKFAGELPADSIDYLWWHSNLYRNRGREFRRAKDYQNAIEASLKSIRFNEEFLRKLPAGESTNQPRIEIARTLQFAAYNQLAAIYIELGKFDLALEMYEGNLALAREWGLEFSMGGQQVAIGDLLRRQSDVAAAQPYYQAALELGRRQQRPEIIMSSASRLGEVLDRTGRSAEAIGYYDEAIRQTESVRSLLATQRERQSYFEGGISAYIGMIGALYNTNSSDRAFDYGERARSRSFIDMLGTKIRLSKATAEPNFPARFVSSDQDHEDDAPGALTAGASSAAERAYQELLKKIRQASLEQASLMSVEPLTLTQVQALLEAGQVLLEYFVTPQQVYLWVVDKQQLHSFSVRLSRAELVQRLGALRSAISERKPLNEYHALAQELYDQLIAPAESFIQGRELIIVPHDVLHNLPFHALVAKDGRYLIEKQPIEYLSSASLMQFTRAKRRVLGKKVLAFGNPAASASVKELKFAEQETAEVKKLFASTTLLQRNEATKDKVKTLARDYDILHFAAHTELKQDDPLASAILLAKSGTDDGRLTVSDIFGMNLKASLVVLSGCETALGKLSRGDELVGLTRAFIYAGTPSVVASLWKVDDASTAHLMSSFYNNLKSKSKVESLRQAQLAMIRGARSSSLVAQRGVGGVVKAGQVPVRGLKSRSSISTAHPYFWAPFILVGDGK